MAVAVKRPPEILHAIVGTAGHVDHGKTSLVKLLTGCDTDRLPEEKARGMSIDLGFAPCTLHSSPTGENKRVVGIVDVPGHRDFIRNMVAGAASIDVLLLVIAADDGIMPQTHEHMKIVRLLRQPRVLVALTKIDMVSPERLEAARAQIAAFLQQAGFPDAPIIPVSNKTCDGIGEILAHIDAQVAAVQRQADPRAFRMSIERVFSVPGYGTVVTGIPLSGAIHISEKVQLLPAPAGHAESELVVRTVQLFKHESDAAWAHACCAINLREISADQVTRGMCIATPDIYQSTKELIVTLENALDHNSATGLQPLKRRFAAQLHAGTAAVEASVRLFDPLVELPAGAAGLAQILLAEPLVAAAGDRFILRSLSPSDTLAGGTVLSVRPQRLRRHANVVERWQAARTAVHYGDLLDAELLAGPDAIIASDEIHRLTQCIGEAARAKVAAATQTGLLVDLGGGDYLVRPRIVEVAAVLENTLARFHHANPYATGMTPTQSCEIANVSIKSFDRLAALLTENTTIVSRNGRLARADFAPKLGERLTILRQRILAEISQAGVNAPARGNLMRDLAIAEPNMKILEKSLLEDRTIRILDGNLMLHHVYEDARAKLVALFQSADTVELATFRDALGTNRKMALAMLDAFDAEGLTRRVGNARVLAHKTTA